MLKIFNFRIGNTGINMLKKSVLESGFLIFFSTCKFSWHKVNTKQRELLNMLKIFNFRIGDTGIIPSKESYLNEVCHSFSS